MKKYVCTVCGWVYDPAMGDPDGGIVPGTPFEDIPEDWVCPLCGVGKDDFEEQEAFLAHISIAYGIALANQRLIFIHQVLTL